MSESIYYNYDKILSYHAILNFLCGSRGVGKTFGATKFVINQYLKKGIKFAYIRRYKNELAKGVKNFFASIEKENIFPRTYI